MKINIQYTQFEPTAGIEEYAFKRFGSIERFLKSFEKHGEITLFLEIARSTKHHRKGPVFYAEAMFETTPGGKTIRASDTQPDIRLAVDTVKEKLKKEIRRHKDTLAATRQRRRKA